MSEYRGNINRCSNVPSRGGIPRADVKMLAKKMGVQTKGLLKAQICNQLVDKLHQVPQSTALIPTSKGVIALQKQVEKDIGHLPNPVLTELLLDMDPEDTRQMCMLSERIMELCVENDILRERLT